MSVSMVAHRYAQALFELGVEQAQLERTVADAESLAAAYRDSADLRRALEDPLVAHDAKKAIVCELADRIGAAPATKSMVCLLVDRRRTRILPAMAEALRRLADARRGLLRAEVTTAFPLPEAFYGRLQAALETMTGRSVIVDRKSDPSLIGGVVARIGDRIFDGSLRTRLQSLRDALMPSN